MIDSTDLALRSTTLTGVRMGIGVCALLVCTCVLPRYLEAQSLNIDFGVGAAPDASFAAAGEAGTWNSLLGTQGTSYSLLDLAGQSTTATVFNIGGSEIVETNHPQTVGATEALLDDFLVTYTPTLETCLFFGGLENGEYLVITYAWLPEEARESWVTVDQSATGGVLVGGDWQGTLSEGVSYSVHRAEVVSGVLGVHSGIPSGGGQPVAALNGIQLVRLLDAPQLRRGDVTRDGVVGLTDVIAQLGTMFGGQGPVACEDTLDANDNGAVGIDDVLLVLNYLFNAGTEPAPPFATCGEDTTADSLGCGDDPCS